MVFSLAPDTLRRMVEHKDHALLEELGGVSGVAQELRSDLERGLDTAVGGYDEMRVLRYGRNFVPPAARQTLWDFLKEAVNDKTMLVLIGAALLSLVLGLTTPDPRTGVVEYATGWIEGAAILASVAIVVLVTAINDYKKQEKFAELETSAAEQTTVTAVRRGTTHGVCTSTLMVGDVLVLEPGMHVNVDLVVIRSTGLICDESDVTGECDEVHKAAGADVFVVSGTNVLEGTGFGVVVAVGVNSVQGSIAMVTRAVKKQTPLEEKLEVLADRIGKFGLFAAVVTFLILAVKETYFLWTRPGGKFVFMKYWEMLTTAVAIVVVAVPEGLPLSVTISLAYSMQQMLEDKNLVRHLAACETMGGATCICSDKTGTLTTNEMRVTKLWLGGVSAAVCKPESDSWIGVVTGDEASMIEVSDHDRIKVDVSDALLKQVTSAIKHSSLDENNRTSIALTYLVNRLGCGDAATCPASQCIRMPFTSVHKQSRTRVRDAATGGSLLFCKGASEIILASCTMWMDSTGAVAPLSRQQRHTIEDSLVQYAEDGLRTLCIAFSRSADAFRDDQSFEDDNLTFLAMVGIEEPIRCDVSDAIAQCKRAGIAVKMVTGDNLLSASTVARRCGIIDSYNTLTMEGKEFREMDASARQEILPSLAVLARATPLDKQLLVQALKQDPLQVVAVTGDGTNDGPALKYADVGFAMNSGTDIAKAASDIILTDDNFVGVTKAVMWGRNVNDNIRKFLQFQLTVNTAACAISVLGAVLSETNLSPLKPVQLLWLNLIMDSLAALGLATGLPTEALLAREPTRKDHPMISQAMWVFIGTQGTYQLCVCLVLMVDGAAFLGLEHYGDEHLTVVFTAFVLLQVFNFFNARQLGYELNVFSEMGQNKTLFCIAVIIAICQV